MDPREPVPLQPMMAWHQKQNMQAHLVAIQRITEALPREDWAAVASAAAMIGSSPQMQMQCEHMGAGADGFTEVALDFHRRADAIAEAAATKDTNAVLAATADTLAACTSCHQTYRQDVMDAETWSARTGDARDPGGH
jgi:cytochrome c556